MAAQLQRELTSRKPFASLRPVAAANPLGLKTNTDQPAKASFGQDFVFEHCRPVRKTVSGEPINPFGDLKNSPQSYGFPC